MKNNILKILIVLFFSLIQLNVSASEQFNFEVTELEITNQGNIIRGLNRGTAISESGIIIEADYVDYNKIKNSTNIETLMKSLSSVPADAYHYFIRHKKDILKILEETR